jgi:hypothetical protein
VSALRTQVCNDSQARPPRNCLPFSQQPRHGRWWARRLQPPLRQPHCPRARHTPAVVGVRRTGAAALPRLRQALQLPGRRGGARTAGSRAGAERRGSVTPGRSHSASAGSAPRRPATAPAGTPVWAPASLTLSVPLGSHASDAPSSELRLLKHKLRSPTRRPAAATISSDAGSRAVHDPALQPPRYHDVPSVASPAHAASSVARGEWSGLSHGAPEEWSGLPHPAREPAVDAHVAQDAVVSQSPPPAVRLPSSPGAAALVEAVPHADRHGRRERSAADPIARVLDFGGAGTAAAAAADFSPSVGGDRETRDQCVTDAAAEAALGSAALRTHAPTPGAPVSAPASSPSRQSDSPASDHLARAPSPETIAGAAPVICGACRQACVGAAALCVHLLHCDAWATLRAGARAAAAPAQRQDGLWPAEPASPTAPESPSRDIEAAVIADVEASFADTSTHLLWHGGGSAGRLTARDDSAGDELSFAAAFSPADSGAPHSDGAGVSVKRGRPAVDNAASEHRTSSERADALPVPHGAASSADHTLVVTASWERTVARSAAPPATPPAPRPIIRLAAVGCTPSDSRIPIPARLAVTARAAAKLPHPPAIPPPLLPASAREMRRPASSGVAARSTPHRPAAGTADDRPIALTPLLPCPLCDAPQPRADLWRHMDACAGHSEPAFASSAVTNRVAPATPAGTAVNAAVSRPRNTTQVSAPTRHQPVPSALPPPPLAASPSGSPAPAGTGYGALDRLRTLLHQLRDGDGSGRHAAPAEGVVGAGRAAAATLVRR